LYLGKTLCGNAVAVKPVYKIRYLPLALDDLKDIVRYISYKLESPQAAERLLAKIDKEVKKIADNPFRCHLYNSTEKLKYEYRILNIDNYSLFYVVGNEDVEIRRVIY
jgi:plasmid stabilization system protein ParE